MTKNTNLHSAKRAKNDEFYTQLTDIEKEVVNYKEHFKGKIVLCNCNDAVHGNFVRYFKDNFNDLELQKIIYTSYGDNAYAYVYDGKETNNWKLKENGDFRSGEMIELLKKADIVCTNPPFSQFREYVAQLVQYDKKFLIIGNSNAVTYKEFFPLIKENKVWLGCTLFCGQMPFFKVPNDTDVSKGAKHYYNENGELFKQVNSIAWFTNLDHQKRHQPLDLYKHYNEEEYPKYDNYDAINVNKTCDIPLDYDGVMGVPITFLDKYCPTQFEIVGEMVSTTVDDYNFGYPYINGNKVYARVLIKKI